MQNAPFTVLYRDDHLVAVDKPAGMFVHGTKLDPHVRETCMTHLRRLIGERVHPAHRLDRATSGVLLFALDKDTLRNVMGQFENREVKKTYLAVVRGFVPESGLIDNPLRREDLSEDLLEAQTEFEKISEVTLPYAVGRYPQSRYSLVRMHPLTGRRHQLRRHFHHISHPIIGDTTYGDGKHNKFFREQLGISRMLLMSESLEIRHPVTGEAMRIEASIPSEMTEIFSDIHR